MFKWTVWKAFERKLLKFHKILSFEKNQDTICLSSLVLSQLCRHLLYILWYKGRHKDIKHFLGGASGKESVCQCRSHNRCGFNPYLGKIPGSRKWQLAPVLLPGKFRGQRSLAGYSPWGCRVRHNWVTKHKDIKQATHKTVLIGTTLKNQI